MGAVAAAGALTDSPAIPGVAGAAASALAAAALDADPEPDQSAAHVAGWGTLQLHRRHRAYASARVLHTGKA